MYQGVPLYRCREAAARTQIPIYRCEVIKVPIRGKTKNSEKQAGAKLGIKSEGDGLRWGLQSDRMLGWYYLLQNICLLIFVKLSPANNILIKYNTNPNPITVQTNQPIYSSRRSSKDMKE